MDSLVPLLLTKNIIFYPGFFDNEILHVLCFSGVFDWHSLSRDRLRVLPDRVQCLLLTARLNQNVGGSSRLSQHIASALVFIRTFRTSLSDEADERYRQGVIAHMVFHT